MKFLLIQLYAMNRSQPIVGLNDIEVQWSSCNLDGLPTERVGSRGGTPSMNDVGKPSPGQRDNLPEVFMDTLGRVHRIEDIYSVRSSQ